MSKQSDLVNITQGDADINGGTIDGTVIGGSTPAAISGTTGTFSGNLTVGPTGDIILEDSSGATYQGEITHTASSPFRSIEYTANGGLGAWNGRHVFISNYNAGADVVNATFGTQSSGSIVNLYGDISFYEDTGTTPKFFWDASAERLGIGTSSARAILDLNTSREQKIRFGTAGSIGETQASAGDYIANNLIVSAESAGTITYTKTTVDFGNAIIQDYSRGITLYTGVTGATSATGTLNNFERLRIDSSGNVGIGTSSPLSPLVVAEGTGQHGFEVQPGTLTYAFAYDRATADYGDLDIGGQTLRFSTDNGTERMRIDSSGNVGIGTSSPAATLQVNGSFRLETAGPVFQFSETDTTDQNFSFRLNNGSMIFEQRSDDFSTQTERMRIDSSGNVGIGTSSPLNFARLTINGAGTLGNPLGGIVLQQAGTDVFYISNVATNNNTDIDLWNPRNGYVRIGTNAQERLRINSSGRVGINNTGLGDSQLAVRNDTNGCFAGTFVNLNAAGWGISVGSDSGVLAYFYADGSRTGGPVGSISENGTSTSYNTTSDYRLKEDVQPMSGASDRVLALNPVNFAWKVDGSRVDGFLAHEVQDIVPEAITGTKDEVDADGNPAYQGIDQSKLVPLLTAALQEALARIETLEARMAALET